MVFIKIPVKSTSCAHGVSGPYMFVRFTARSAADLPCNTVQFLEGFGWQVWITVEGNCGACLGFSRASRAEQQAERSRALADEDVSRIRGQLLSLSSMHQADATATPPQSSSPTQTAHHPGIDRCATSSDDPFMSHSSECLMPVQPPQRARHSLGTAGHTRSPKCGPACCTTVTQLGASIAQCALLLFAMTEQLQPLSQGTYNLEHLHQDAVGAIAHVTLRSACHAGPESFPGSRLELVHGLCPVED